MSEPKYLSHIQDLSPLVSPYTEDGSLCTGSLQNTMMSGNLLLERRGGDQTRLITICGRNDAESFAMLWNMAKGCTVGELRSIGDGGLRKLIDLLKEKGLISQTSIQPRVSLADWEFEKIIYGMLVMRDDAGPGNHGNVESVTDFHGEVFIEIIWSGVGRVKENKKKLTNVFPTRDF